VGLFVENFRGIVMNYKHGGILAVLLLLLACSSSPKTYREAKVISSSQEKDLFEWVKKYQPEIAKVSSGAALCLPSEPQGVESEIGQHEIVLELGAVGEVIQVFMANGTRIERCLSKMVSKRTLPPPPLAPAYLPMSINVYIPDPEVSNEPIVRDVIKDER
jgi:hypothetical protein